MAYYPGSYMYPPPYAPPAAPVIVEEHIHRGPFGGYSETTVIQSGYGYPAPMYPPPVPYYPAPYAAPTTVIIEEDRGLGGLGGAAMGFGVGALAGAILF